MSSEMLEAIYSFYLVLILLILIVVATLTMKNINFEVMDLSIAMFRDTRDNNMTTRPTTYCLNCFLGYDYKWANMSSNLISEWYPSKLDKCILSGGEIPYCLSINNDSSHRSPYHWDWSKFVPESLSLMPVGFDAEKGPSYNKLVDVFKLFYKNNIVVINIGDSVSLQLLRSIQYELSREYRENVIITPPFQQLYNDEFLKSSKLYDFSVLVPVDKFHSETMEFKLVHIRNYKCEKTFKRVINAIYRYKDKHKAEIGYKWTTSPRFVIIYNLGVHCHNFDEYRDILNEDFDSFQRFTDVKITFFYKQTSTQHFRTETGEYNGTVKSSVATVGPQCVPTTPQKATMYEKAEDEAVVTAYNRYLKSRKTLNQINVLPFRNNRRYWDLHVKKAGDCTHFSEYAPLMYQPLFNTLYNYFLGNKTRHGFNKLD